MPRCTEPCLAKTASWFGGLRLQYNIGALTVRIGCWGPLYYDMILIRNPQNSIGSRFRVVQGLRVLGLGFKG